MSASNSLMSAIARAVVRIFSALISLFHSDAGMIYECMTNRKLRIVSGQIPSRLSLNSGKRTIKDHPAEEPHIPTMLPLEALDTPIRQVYRTSTSSGEVSTGTTAGEITGKLREMGGRRSAEIGRTPRDSYQRVGSHSANTSRQQSNGSGRPSEKL